MAPDRLEPGDADQMRDFADRCRRVAVTAQKVASAENGYAATLMVGVAHYAGQLRDALLSAARFADPLGEDGSDD